MKRKALNVRVYINEKGKYEIGFAHCLYKKKGGYEWKDACKTDISNLKAKLEHP